MSSPSASLLALVTLAGVAVGLLGALALLHGALSRRAAERSTRWHTEQVRLATGASLARSRAVLRGQLVEHLAPMWETETFPDPGDARFLGRPVDFVVFDGYGDVRAGRATTLREIVFVEVKTGASRLSGVERSLRDCVDAHRVRTLVLGCLDPGDGSPARTRGQARTRDQAGTRDQARRDRTGSRDRAGGPR